MTLEQAREQVVLAIHAITGALDNQALAAMLSRKDGDVTLSELDIDSLAAMAVCLEIENGTGVILDLGDVASHPSVGGLAQLLATRASANAG
jgi:acyl carrier protein